MSVRSEILLLAAAGCMTCSIGTSAPLIEATNGSGPAAESHVPVMGDLLADPTDSLTFKAVEFADRVVQLATRDDDASLGDPVIKVATVATPTATDAGPDPCPSAEGAACVSEPRKDRTQPEAVAKPASTAPEATFIEALPITLLCLGIAGCLVLGLGPIVGAFSTHRQRKRWRAIKGRLVDAARGH